MRPRSSVTMAEAAGTRLFALGAASSSRSAPIRPACAAGEPAYRAIEVGAQLPEEPVRFLDAVAAALGLWEHAAPALRRAYAHSLIEAELGPEVAASVLPPSRPP